MDVLFASLESSHHAVREGFVTDPRPPHCRNCGREPIPGRKWCDCGLPSVLRAAHRGEAVSATGRAEAS